MLRFLRATDYVIGRAAHEICELSQRLVVVEA
jgi:hypothetical protein